MTLEYSLIANGRFLTDLSSWTATNTAYVASDGDLQYGMAAIALGGSLAQTFTVARPRTYTIRLFVKAASTLGAGAATLALTANGAAVTSYDLTGGTAWTENTFTLGLVPNVTYTLTIASVSLAVKVDDMYVWPVAITRAALAARVQSRLTALATDAGYVTTPAGELTEGDYTFAIDEGLRQVGATDPDSDQPDVRALTVDTVDVAIQAIERLMLKKLYRYYSLQVDISVGPRRESLSQIAKSIKEVLDESAADAEPLRVLGGARASLYYDGYHAIH